MRLSLALSGFALASVLLTGGCAVGPDFQQPAPPQNATYDSPSRPQPTESATTLHGEAQRFKAGQDVPAAWWTLFRSKPLDRLVTKALNANPDLQSAEAALREAQENSAAATGAFFPQINGAANATREKISESSAGSGASIEPFSLFNASVNVSYVLDVFGGTRRAAEGAEAQVDVQKYERDAARLTLIANVVTSAVAEAALRGQIDATHDVLAAERKQRDVLKAQFDLGGAAKAAVLAQDALLAQTEATLPTLDKQLAQTRHQLGALAGQFPQEELDSFTLDKMRLPVELPMSLPSALVERRPDIKAAEARLHAASAAIGVATATMLPQINLSASYGAQANAADSLFSPAGAVWSAGAGLLQPLFHGGTLRHERNAAGAAYDAADAQYRSVVLAAFQNVADSLRALQADAQALKAQDAAVRATKASFDLSRDQFQAGAVSYLALLTSEQAYHQSRIAFVQAQARRLADTAALFQALGAGAQDNKGQTEN